MNKNKGFILLEGVISIFLVSLLLIPLFNFSNIFINLSNNNIKTAEFQEDFKIKEQLLLGYDEIIRSNNKILFGTFNNIGISSQVENRNFIFFNGKSDNYNRRVKYILTPISNYRECLWKKMHSL